MAEPVIVLHDVSLTLASRAGPVEILKRVDVDITPHLGTYERASVRIDVLEQDGQPTVRTELTGPLAALVPETVHEYPLTAVEDSLFVVREPEAQTWTPLTFYALPSGEKYLHFGARATPKVG